MSLNMTAYVAVLKPAEGTDVWLLCLLCR